MSYHCSSSKCGGGCKCDPKALLQIAKCVAKIKLVVEEGDGKLDVVLECLEILKGLTNGLCDKIGDCEQPVCEQLQDVLGCLDQIKQSVVCADTGKCGPVGVCDKLDQLIHCIGCEHPICKPECPCTQCKCGTMPDPNCRCTKCGCARQKCVPSIRDCLEQIKDAVHCDESICDLLKKIDCTLGDKQQFNPDCPDEPQNVVDALIKLKECIEAQQACLDQLKANDVEQTECLEVIKGRIGVPCVSQCDDADDQPTIFECLKTLKDTDLTQNDLLIKIEALLDECLPKLKAADESQNACLARLKELTGQPTITADTLFSLIEMIKDLAQQTADAIGDCGNKSNVCCKLGEIDETTQDTNECVKSIKATLGNCGDENSVCKRLTELRGVADATKSDTSKLVAEIGECLKSGDGLSVCGRLGVLKDGIDDLKSDVADVDESVAEVKNCVVKVDEKIGDCGKGASVCSKLCSIEQKTEQTHQKLENIQTQITNETNEIDACLADVKQRIGTCGDMPVCARLTTLKEKVDVNCAKLDTLKDQVKTETDEIDKCLDKVKCDVEKVQATVDRIEDDLDCGGTSLCGRLQQIQTDVQLNKTCLDDGFAETDSSLEKLHKAVDDVHDKLGDCTDVTVCGQLSQLLVDVAKVKECVIEEDDDIEEAVKTLQLCVNQLKEALNCDGGTLCQCLMTIKSFLTQHVGDCQGVTVCARLIALKTAADQTNNTLGMCEGVPVCDRLKTIESKVDSTKTCVNNTQAAVETAETNVCAKIGALSTKVDAQTDEIDACLESIKCDNLGKSTSGTVHSKLDILKDTTASIDAKLKCGDRDLCGVLSDLSDQVADNTSASTTAVKACVANTENALGGKIDDLDAKLGNCGNGTVCGELAALSAGQTTLEDAIGDLSTKIDTETKEIDDCLEDIKCNNLGKPDNGTVHTKLDNLLRALGECEDSGSLCAELGNANVCLGDLKAAIGECGDKDTVCAKLHSILTTVESIGGALTCDGKDFCASLESLQTEVVTQIKACIGECNVCEELSSLGTAIGALDAKLGPFPGSSVANELSDLSTKVGDEADKVKACLDTAEANLDGKLQTIDSKVTNVQATLDDCDGQSLCERIRAIGTAVDDVATQTTLTSVDGKVDDIVTALGSCETSVCVQLGNLASGQTTLDGAIGELSAKVDAQTDEIDACLEEIKCDILGKPDGDGTIQEQLGHLKKVVDDIDGALKCGDDDTPLCARLQTIEDAVNSVSESLTCGDDATVCSQLAAVLAAVQTVKDCLTTNDGNVDSELTLIKAAVDALVNALGDCEGKTVCARLDDLQVAVDAINDCDGKTLCATLGDLSTQIETDTAAVTSAVNTRVGEAETALANKIDDVAATLGNCETPLCAQVGDLAGALSDLSAKVDTETKEIDDCLEDIKCNILGKCGDDETVCSRLIALQTGVDDVKDALFCDPDDTPLCARLGDLQTKIDDVDAALKCGPNDTPICDVLATIDTNVVAVETCVGEIKTSILGDCGTEPVCVRLGDLQEGVAEIKDMLVCGEDPLCSVLGGIVSDIGSVDTKVMNVDSKLTSVGTAVDGNTILLNMIKDLLSSAIQPAIDEICTKIESLENKIDELSDKINTGEGVLEDINVSVGDIQLTMTAQGGAGGEGGTGAGGSGTGGTSSAATGAINNDSSAETGAVDNQADASSGDIDNTSDASSGDVAVTSDASSGDINNADTNSDDDTSGDINTTIDNADTNTVDNQDNTSTSGISDDDAVNSVIDATEATNTGSNAADVIESSNDPTNNVQSTSSGQVTTNTDNTVTGSEQQTEADVANSNQNSQVGGNNEAAQQDSSNEANTNSISPTNTVEGDAQTINFTDESGVTNSSDSGVAAGGANDNNSATDNNSASTTGANTVTNGDQTNSPAGDSNGDVTNATDGSSVV